MVKVICWDMDGTIANLYGVDNWLNKLDTYDPSPYAEAPPMWDMGRLSNLVSALMKKRCNHLYYHLAFPHRNRGV